MLLIGKNKIDNLNRKIIHIVSAIIICFFPYFLSVGQIVALSLIFSFIFLISKYLGFLPIINRVKRVSLGEVFYPLGVMISSLIFLTQGETTAFQFGVLVLGFSDALANILGDLYGRHRINFSWGGKSLEGSLAFLLSTILILFFMNGKNIYPSQLINCLFLSLVLTILELILFFGLDNLFLPTIASYLFIILF